MKNPHPRPSNYQQYRLSGPRGETAGAVRVRLATAGSEPQPPAPPGSGRQAGRQMKPSARVRGRHESAASGLRVLPGRLDHR